MLFTRVRLLAHVMNCPEKARLIEEHHQAALIYSQATRALSEIRGLSEVSEYKRLSTAVDEARAKSIEARLAIIRHTAEHGC
jgi:hypothetical protein